ncbi:MAG: DUF3179 domain-containing protein [Gemmataceae bacterium]|nr:DUF3179 domain-containing protein [Gemmataceae bacterium]
MLPHPSHSQPEAAPLLSRSARWSLLATSAVAVAAAIAGAVYLQPPLAPEPPIVESTAPGFPRVPAYAINDPQVLPAGAATLKDDEPIIGVFLDGKHRAYRVRAFCEYPMVHVVNDRLGDHPVSVAHCDRTGCTVVVQEAKGSPRLRLAFGGWYRGHMYVRANGDHFYCLKGLERIDPQSPLFPYAPVEFERTTWGAWRQAHPDTDVYVTPPPQSAISSQ